MAAVKIPQHPRNRAFFRTSSGRAILAGICIIALFLVGNFFQVETGASSDVKSQVADKKDGKQVEQDPDQMYAHRKRRPRGDVLSALKYLERANELMEKGDFKKMMEETERAIEVAPEYPYGYAMLGVACDMQMEYTKGVEAWTKAIEIQPEMYDFHLSLGLSLSNLYRSQMQGSSTRRKTVKKAMKAFEVFVENCPTDRKEERATALVNLGAAYLEVKTNESREKALGILTEALELNPEDDMAFYNLGAVQTELYIATQNPEFKQQAIINLNQAVSMDPSNEAAREFLSRLYQVDDLMDQAEAHIARDQGMDPLEQPKEYHEETLKEIEQELDPEVFAHMKAAASNSEL